MTNMNASFAAPNLKIERGVLELYRSFSQHLALMIVEIANVYPGPAENPDTRDEMETGRRLHCPHRIG